MRLSTEALSAALSRHYGAETSVDGLTRLSGGASRETWTFAVRTATACEELVLRRDPGAAIGQTDRSTEFALLQAAEAAGVAVPRVRFLLEPGDDLGSGFVMDHVAGETIPRKILRDEKYARARDALVLQCGAAAAAIHAIDVASLPELPLMGADDQVDQWAAYLATLDDPHPGFELGIRWLRGNLPEPTGAPCLVHGDFRNGNLIVAEDGLRAVLDWELAHLGDPIEDLGWMCVKSWRFGNADRIAGGFGSMGALLDAYESAGGRRPDEERLRWWCTLGTLKWGLICRLQSEAHLSGAVRSVELATLGRRIVEMEWDTLALVEGGW